MVRSNALWTEYRYCDGYKDENDKYLLNALIHLYRTQSLIMYYYLCSNEVLMFKGFHSLQNMMLGHSSMAVG